MAESFLNNLSVNPGSGHYANALPAFLDDLMRYKDPANPNAKAAQSFAIPDSLTQPSGGYEQHTFLGASITNWSINAGYGDSVSTLNIDLVEDEFNKSDKTPLGLGVDVYHSGILDTFNPPFTGSPVYFSFGKTRATVNDAFTKVYDDLFGLEYHKQNANTTKAQFHFNFGGILQSFVRNRGQGGNPIFSVQIVDPREILSNVVLILNNYTGTTFNNKNMFNLYGFLEYNPTQELLNKFKTSYRANSLRKTVRGDGSYFFTGNDMYSGLTVPDTDDYNIYNDKITYPSLSSDSLPARFPITGTGKSRRTAQGIPYYRIRQALNALLSIDGKIPEEYQIAGFGGYVNFRGFNYVVDLGGLLDKVPPYYFFDFDQINLLDFCLEICDITSSDLFVSLLPIIQHPVCERFYKYNQEKILGGDPASAIAGIIRVDVIDRSFQPKYGAIKQYMDDLEAGGLYVENQDLGYELSNVVTDKFIAGAQEVETYLFSSNADRDTIEVKKQQSGLENKANALLANQWTLEESLSQQILPFYGLLGNKAISIPKGFGAYQQILIDSSTWEVNGIGNYYVATEMELRAAIISYETWSNFLIGYNDIYMESVEEDDVLEGAALSNSPPNGWPNTLPSLSNNFAVTVPRSVFTSSDNSFGADNLPNSPCNPPYGYPLYYKRCTKLGVQGAGLSDITSVTTSIQTSLAAVRGSVQSGANWQEVINTIWQEIENSIDGDISDIEQEYIDFIKSIINNPQADVIGLIDDFSDSLAPVISVTTRLTRKTAENAMKAYNFIKKFADDHLGKKFLVKIPREVNLSYNNFVLPKDNNLFVSEYAQGPFGFRPRAINSKNGYEQSQDFATLININREIARALQPNMMKGFLTRAEPNPQIFQGALNVNYNPIADQHEFNYLPEKQGGYVNFDLLSNYTQQKQNLAISQGLLPIDMANFMNENSRMSPYVRFDNSQDLSFDLIGKESFTQQIVSAGYFVPDVSDILDNTKVEENKFMRFPQQGQISSEPPRPKTIAFVKCDVDDNLYLAPSTAYMKIPVHGSKTRDIGKYSIPKKVFNTKTCQSEPSFRYYEPHFIPVPGSTFTVDRLDYVRDANGDILTQPQTLDQNHVYALITLPNRVIPIGDSRFRDGMFQQKNAQFIKHFMTMDVVRLPEFNSPAYLNGAKTDLINKARSIIDPGALGHAIMAFNASLQGLDAATNRINNAMPSPVYPDLVALPLMSKDRCYGPWVSSTFDNNASDIGGKIEFIKDENLAPWNFNGYDLMNEMGMLQASMSNSLLLSSERGGFVYPGAPSGIAIGRFLADAGPLISNIGIEVSSSNIKTTIKMDLYTAQFGKLQKQKSDMISNISRERQKLKDERNALIRKGMGKNQKNINYSLIYEQLKAGNVAGGAIAINPSNSINGTVNYRNTGYSTNTYGLFGAGESSDTDARSHSATAGDASTSAGVLSEAPDRHMATDLHARSASTPMTDLYIPASMDLSNPHMSHRQDGFVDSKDMYDDGLDNNDLTFWS